MSGAAVVLADIERLCWQLSGWRVEPRDVSRLLTAVEAYARGEEFFTEGGTVTLVGPDPQTPPEAAPETLTGADADVVEPECPEPVSGAQTGVQHVVHSGEITLCVVAGSSLLTWVPDTPREHPPHAPEPATPNPVTAPPHTEAFAPVPTGDGGMRVCRRAGCESNGTAQPITEFARYGKNSPERKWACRTCENKRKRDARKRGAARVA